MNLFSIPPVAFYFLRHGETEWNREKRVMGHIDIPLDSRGIEQAQEASQSLKNLDIKHLATSPLLRAKETADIIGAYLRLTPEVNEDLSEICWGEWQGKKVDEGYDFEKWVEGYTPKGAESCMAFQERVEKPSQQH